MDLTFENFRSCRGACADAEVAATVLPIGVRCKVLHPAHAVYYTAVVVAHDFESPSLAASLPEGGGGRGGGGGGGGGWGGGGGGAHIV